MIVEKLKSILDSLCEAEEDAIKSEAGNLAAGRRARKQAMEAIKSLKEFRALILEASKK
tara:strand:+ start:725 stop:901 length:177 start_codon:yes stop_codon:yes gene_type:complete